MLSTMSKSKCTKHTTSEHFWKLRCQKSAHGCGAKHMSKPNCKKTEWVGAPFDIQMPSCLALYIMRLVKNKQLQLQPPLCYPILHSPPLSSYSYLHCTTFMTIRNATPDYHSLQYINLHHTTHDTTLHCLTLHYRASGITTATTTTSMSRTKRWRKFQR